MSPARPSAGARPRPEETVRRTGGALIKRRPLLQGLGLALATPISLAAPTNRRIVSVGGAVTETIYALGAQASLVGVDTTSIYPTAARTLPSVGYARQLSAEGVLSLAPTLIVASDEAGPPAVLRQLEAAKVPVQVLAAGGLIPTKCSISFGYQLFKRHEKYFDPCSKRCGSVELYRRTIYAIYEG